MFVGGEVLLDVSFDVAGARLADLIRGGNVLTASQDAYGEGVAGRTRGGPPEPGLAASRLVEVKFGSPVARGDSVVVALRWEVIGPDGGLFPALDADLTLDRAGADATVLRLAGAYRPPLGALGAGPDRVILYRVAASTARGFLGCVGAAITHPASVTGPASGNGGRGRSLPPPDADLS